jgi:hypothetical protein
VKDSHLDLSTERLKIAGLPKSESYLAIFSHRFQEGFDLVGMNLGGASIEPMLDPSVIEPMVVKTKSFLPTSI